MGCDFDELVVLDEIDRLFQSEGARWSQDDVFIAACCADVSELFALGHVDDEVVITAVFSCDHAFVDFIPRADEQRAAIL